MTRKITTPILIIGAALLLSYALVALAASEADITFPVAELGNCQNKQECHAYCDQPENFKACFAFAKKHNLLQGPLADKPDEELDRFSEAMKSGGPGGCTTQRQCEAYCGDVSNMDECLAFAEKHNLIDEEELAEAKKVQGALARGAKLPGGCTNKESCEEYCMNPDHMEECLAFAEEASFMSPDELAQAKKAMELMRRGETPGGCRSQKQCEAYCQDDSHFQECIEFGKKMGFINPEEAEKIQKIGKFGGPGGCKGERECRAYCEDPAHQEECFNFAKEHGFISEEELQQIKEGPRRLQEALQSAPPEVAQCVKSAIRPELLEKIQAGDGFVGHEIGEKVKNCFDQFMPPPQFDFPPEVQSCVESKLGADFVEKLKSGAMDHQEIEGVIKGCFEQFGTGPAGFPGEEHPDFRHEGIQSGQPSESFIDFSQFPPQVAECVKSKLGSTVPASPVEIEPVIRACFTEFGTIDNDSTDHVPTLPEEHIDENFSKEEFCQKYPEKCQADFQETHPAELQDFQNPPSPEEFCAQYPERCAEFNEGQHQSQAPTLGEFLLGLVAHLILGLR